ncbi:MAG: hypothetical protein CBD16_05995 [Betaproteobacteria bacterium TMED156]|nr:MAG: hypothetical protein CBD16_05995 [Betaproteobacteria bacterium TMED156]|tara:strand:- start:2067 stop:2729 length:663 start_codon:yes stop_codon:yes gene_type:complete
MPKDTSNHSDSEIFRKSISGVTPLKGYGENKTQIKEQKNYDSKIFLDAVSDAIPLSKIKNPKKNLKRKPKAVPVQSLLDESEALMESQLADINNESILDTDENLSFARNGISALTVKKLRKGNWKIQDELDLHGLITSEAREAFYHFIKRCFKDNKRCVRIIHGKGLRSLGKEPVLKNKVKGWLKQTNEVLAFCHAPREMGGSGAVLVLLRARRYRSHQS